MNSNIEESKKFLSKLDIPNEIRIIKDNSFIDVDLGKVLNDFYNERLNNMIDDIDLNPLEIEK